MKKGSLTGVLPAMLVLCGVSIGQVYEDFNELNDGAVHKQSFWWGGNNQQANQAFQVMDELGVTQSPGDKALIVSSVGANLKVRCNKTVSWEPGATVVFEVDFQIGLSDQPMTEIFNGFAVQLGDPKLEKETRLVLGVGTGPDGKWYIRGNAPHWENLKPLPAESIVVQPAAGESAVSKWFHLKLSSTKSTTPNVFKTNLLITDAEGTILVNHDFKEDPVTGAMTDLWMMDSAAAGISVQKTFNGLACIDNLSLTSTPAEKKVKGLADLLQ